MTTGDSHGAAHTALITGASSGIGLELARMFASHGHRLVLVARGQEKLDQVASQLQTEHGIGAEALCWDLGLPDAAATLAAELERRSIPVDILVNNAGFATRGLFADTDSQETQQLLMVNIVALTGLTRLLLPAMRARGYGRILNVASIAAWFPGPLTATYNASKAYVLSLSEALANELAGTPVTVTVLCPGPTRTGFETRAGLSRTKAFRGQTMEAAVVARIGYDALMAGKTVAIPGLQNRLRMLPLRWVPRSVLAKFARDFHEDPQDHSKGT